MPHTARQSGTPEDELLVGAAPANSAVSGSDVVLAGRTEGDWAASNAGGTDFCVVKLDADGNELWVWQVTIGQNKNKLAVVPSFVRA